MARTKISEFSATAADNTDIDNINIAEGCAPSGINNAIRELMAQLKDMQTGASGDTFTLTTVNSTTVDTTNLEATNLKAKDGTSAGSIADSTGIVTLASTVLTTTDINGGTIDNATIGATTPSTVKATQVDITAQGDLRLQDTTGGQYVALQAPGTVATSYTLTLPVDDGTAGQALITDGSGVLSWSSAASGDVYGPASATDNAVARYDGTTGKIIQNSAVTIADNGATVIAANSTSAGLRITQVGTGNALLVEDAANPDSTPFVVNSSGLVLVGGAAVTGMSSASPQLQVTGYGDGSIGNNAASLALNGFLPSGAGHKLDFNRSNGATVGTNTIVANGDQLGLVRWGGADGTNYIRAAQIAAEVDGTPGTNDMPGRLVFSTTADGASSPTERMRIDSAGQIGFGSIVGGANVSVRKNMTGAATTYGVLAYSEIRSDVTSNAHIFQTLPSTQAAAFTLTNLRHYYANNAGFGAGSTVTNQFGFHAESSLTGATNNYGFYSAIASGTGRWNFYANGTADNYFAGKVGVGMVPSNQLDVSASTYCAVGVTSGAVQGQIAANASGSVDVRAVSNHALILYSNNTERMRITNAGTISLGAAPGAESLRVTPVASAVNYLTVSGSATGFTPNIQAQGSDTNIAISITSKGGSPLDFFTSAFGAQQFRIAHTASAVNYLQVTGGATGNSPVLSAQGSDANISFVLQPKGTGNLSLQSNANIIFSNTSGALQFVVNNTASSVNYIQANGAVTTGAPQLAVFGSDTNIDLALIPKGTGKVRFGTHTANADAAITGYITIKDSAGNLRKLAIIN